MKRRCMSVRARRETLRGILPLLDRFEHDDGLPVGMYMFDSLLPPHRRARIRWRERQAKRRATFDRFRGWVWRTGIANGHAQHEHLLLIEWGMIAPRALERMIDRRMSVRLAEIPLRQIGSSEDYATARYGAEVGHEGARAAQRIAARRSLEIRIDLGVEEAPPIPTVARTQRKETACPANH